MTDSRGTGAPAWAAAAIALVALAVGVVVGASFTKTRQGSATGMEGSESDAPAGSADKNSSAAGVGPSTPDVASRADSAAKLAEDAKEIARLRERVAELEKQVPKPPTKEDRIAIAKELVECLRKGKKNSEGLRRLLQLLPEVDPDMGPYFLERVNDPAETADRNALMALTLGAGGQEVADWLLARLSDPATAAELRGHLLDLLSGDSKDLLPIRKLPVQGRLADLSFRYAGSSDTDERRAAAGLLGNLDSPESRTALYRLAGDVSDFELQRQAIRSLAAVGDAETLIWLETNESSICRHDELKITVAAARESLQKKFPK